MSDINKGSIPKTSGKKNIASLKKNKGKVVILLVVVIVIIIVCCLVSSLAVFLISKNSTSSNDSQNGSRDQIDSGGNSGSSGGGSGTGSGSGGSGGGSGGQNLPDRNLCTSPDFYVSHQTPQPYNPNSIHQGALDWISGKTFPIREASINSLKFGYYTAENAAISISVNGEPFKCYDIYFFEGLPKFTINNIVPNSEFVFRVNENSTVLEIAMKVEDNLYIVYSRP